MMKTQRKVLIASGMLLCALLSGVFGLRRAEAQEKPRCHSNQDCLMPGMVGTCQNPGQPGASCVYQELTKVEAVVILPKNCQSCVFNSHAVLNDFKALFPGLSVEVLDSDTERAGKFIQDLKIEMLPAYILSRQVEKDPNFAQIQRLVDLIGDHYYIKPSFVGVSYFVGRPVLPGQLDLFLALIQPGADKVLKVAKDVVEKKQGKLKFALHFIGKRDEETGELLSPAGPREVNEDRLYACVEKNYPQKSWEYLLCRTGNIDSLWWDSCLTQNGMDPDKMRACAESKESDALVGEKNKLAEELRIFYSPIFLLDNVEVLTVGQNTTADEVLKVIDARIQGMSKPETNQ